MKVLIQVVVERKVNGQVVRGSQRTIEVPRKVANPSGISMAERQRAERLFEKLLTR